MNKTILENPLYFSNSHISGSNANNETTKPNWSSDSLHYVVDTYETEEGDVFEVHGVEDSIVDYDWLIKNADDIVIDTKTQRKLKPWKQDVSQAFLVKNLKGTAVTQWVLVNLELLKTTSERLLQNKALSSTQIENLNQTLEWVTGHLNNGKKWHLSDGQHRFNWALRYFRGGRSHNNDGTQAEGGTFVPKFDPKKTDDATVPIEYTPNVPVGIETLNKKFSHLPSDFQEMIRNIPIRIVTINSPNMDLVTDVFESVNSGTGLSQIDLITNLWTPLAQWLRGTESDGLINTFLYGNIISESNLVIRKQLMKLLEAVMYLYSSGKNTFPYREQMDNKKQKYHAVGPISNISMDFVGTVDDVLITLANGLKNNYNGDNIGKFRLFKYGQLSSFWLMVVLTHMVKNKSSEISSLHQSYETDDLPMLSNKTIHISDEAAWVEELADMITTLGEDWRYYYLDENGNMTTTPQKDENGDRNPLKDEDGNPLEDEHSFHRKLTAGRSMNANGPIMIDSLIKEFESRLPRLLEEDIITTRSTKRTLTKKERVSLAPGKVISNQTGKAIPKHDILNGSKIHATHPIGKSHKDGGEEIGLGEADLNKRLGAS